MSFNENIKKLNDLNLNNKPSLLSTSLANQKDYQNIPIPRSSQLSQPVQLQAFNENDEEIKDHPEPELLATSVDGKLVPSSSNISLFSLNQSTQYSPKLEPIKSSNNSNANVNTTIGQASTIDGFNLASTTSQTSPSTVNHQNNNNSNNNLVNGATNQSQFTSPQLVQGEFKRNRNSISSLNQKRYENYRLTSPPINDGINYTSTNAIPINNKILNVPDSPNLDPTSLNGSPSRFWLSSQTPPKSLNNSFKRLSTLSDYQKHQLNSQWSQINPSSNLSQQLQSQLQNQTQYQPPHQGSQSPLSSHKPNIDMSSLNQQLESHVHQQKLQSVQPMTIPQEINGGDSPILNPQTPNEDQPMTPLYLNNEYLSNQYNYFNIKNSTINHINEEDESDDETNDNDKRELVSSGI